MKNNPPAFPVPLPRATEGMTLRDYFAARAMQSYISSEVAICGLDKMYGTDEIPHRVAIAAYRFADAMLERREQ